MEKRKRLIDANELLRFLENEIDKFESALNKWERDYVKAVRVAAKILRCFPTVDAVEVVRGRWIEHRPNVYECTACHTWYGNYGGNEEWRYCPNCGAKMDGGKDE